MIVSRRKPVEAVLAMLQGVKKVGLVGCKSCASACAVGGEKECLEMKAFLEEQGFDVVGIALPDESCHKMLVRRDIKPLSEAEAIVSMACGSGCQTVAANAKVPVYPANDTLFVGLTERVGMFHETCRTCGNCVLGETGGICPMTQCAKSLVNGPCGGQKNGKCEVNPANDCAWIAIYNKLESLNQLHKMEATLDDHTPRDYPQSVNLREGKK